jgi:hypothetical protein
MAASDEACDECGWPAAGGRAGCRARFDDYIARDFSDVLYFRTHRLFVDTYALQHPDQFCRSAKSLAAHLVGLGWILESGASPAIGPDALHRWLDGRTDLDKPALPVNHGAITIGDLSGEADPAAWADQVLHWAHSTWQAYAPLHAQAREWLARASRTAA